jgi:hypothetical protein
VRWLAITQVDEEMESEDKAARAAPLSSALQLTLSLDEVRVCAAVTRCLTLRAESHASRGAASRARRAAERVRSRQGVPGVVRGEGGGVHFAVTRMCHTQIDLAPLQLHADVSRWLRMLAQLLELPAAPARTPSARAALVKPASSMVRAFERACVRV